MAEKIRKKEIFDGVEIETIYREARRPAPPKVRSAEEGPPDDPMEAMGHGFCPPFNQRTYVAEDGIMCEQDIPVTLRDGTIIYTDIYRPMDRRTFPPSSRGATSASARGTALTSGRSWAFRRERSPA